MEAIDITYKGDNCKSKSEFIEKAVLFYIGYLKQENNVDYLAPIIKTLIEGLIGQTEERLSKLLFKVSVELAKLSNILAATQEIDDETLKRLQQKCVQEVRKINGMLTYERVYRYQHYLE
ncbi:hypothetical protein [Diplocloster hominis]|uniref:hypothetical protein n=1 Tax=Diplocloster hominis TaxID=3079010 RepID=UPI0031BA2FA3